MEIGHKLKKLREANNLSQKHVAYFLEISQKTWSNIESNKSKIGLARLSKFSQLMNYDILELFMELEIVTIEAIRDIQKNADDDKELVDKMNRQFTERLKEKDEMIALLKEKIERLNGNLK
ncbi:XRE family transcriptional regulator [Aureibaculum marinum]|uniref:XRE family transcriptional regulator n=1 Tax=Aureibaculum marinum TaxID=2487930 RepID=A0A3N4NN91_9FLAO|nr:helix-turn-helix transcriptional regulator [Aureibaculum marinum]RPD97784.1 XRE family transcriptional regulator [Aureibaculum marinum]